MKTANEAMEELLDEKI